MGRSGHNVSDFDIFLGNVSSKKERDINRLNEESNMILNVNLYKTAQNRRSVNTNATFFFDFTVPKFGTFRNNIYLCSVRTYVLTIRAESREGKTISTLPI